MGEPVASRARVWTITIEVLSHHHNRTVHFSAEHQKQPGLPVPRFSPILPPGLSGSFAGLWLDLGGLVASYRFITQYAHYLGGWEIRYVDSPLYGVVLSY